MNLINRLKNILQENVLEEEEEQEEEKFLNVVTRSFSC